jgi:hypothetical protein
MGGGADFWLPPSTEAHEDGQCARRKARLGHKTSHGKYGDKGARKQETRKT